MALASNDDGAAPDIERGTILDRLADAERDRDQVDNQRRPQAERDRHRHFADDQMKHAFVAKIGCAEIEAAVIAEHFEIALPQRLVEAELVFPVP